MRCIYCKQEKDDSQFSLEHIVPQSIGGKFVQDLATEKFNIFTTKHVCQKCNNTFGCTVDDACIRSLFIYEAREIAEKKGVGRRSHFPFAGQIVDLSSKDETCDLYYCAGYYVFCFYPAKPGYESHIGGNPINRRKGNNSTAVLYHSKNEGITNSQILLLFEDHFKKHKRYSINVPDNKAIFSPVDEKGQEYIDKCKRIIGSPVRTCFIIDKLNARRLYYKIALGIGYKLFGWDFLESDNAKELYKGLHKQENETRGADYLMNEPLINNDLTIFGAACSLSLTRIGMQLGLKMSLYGKAFSLLLCSDVTLYGKTIDWLQLGVTYVWDKERKLRTGPHNYGELAAHRIGLREIPTLTEIDPSSFGSLKA